MTTAEKKIERLEARAVILESVVVSLALRIFGDQEAQRVSRDLTKAAGPAIKVANAKKKALPYLREKTIDDTRYEFTRAFRGGAWDFWNGIGYHRNPHRDGTQRHWDWNDGHTLASSGALKKDEVRPL